MIDKKYINKNFMEKSETYSPSDYGKKEEKMMRKYKIQVDDARHYFVNCVKPRLDRAYKLYMSYNGDRAREIESWQANIFIPYTHAVVETLVPRILDARPEFTVQGRTEDDQLKAPKVQQTLDFDWETSGMDDVSEELTRASMIYGTGFLQVGWKIDKNTYSFLDSKSLSENKYKWKKKEVTFYDGPSAECVDNYELWYDWHNIPKESKQYWFRRKVLSKDSIVERYPYHDPNRLKKALLSGSGDIQDYANIRNEIKSVHSKISTSNTNSSTSGEDQVHESTADSDLKMYEVFEWWRPFDDAFAVMVNDVPILKGGCIPNPFDFKQVPIIPIQFLKLPFEFEGMGIPLILENPQLLLNTIKNQRLDNATLSIHKMWIVNPLANIAKEQLVTRPFGIIYSPDPNGVKEVQFGDIKESAYREEELLKEDMRYASGVDDYSMAASGNAGSATEVRHLRESTLERVRLFINHLGTGYSQLMRYWIDMERQFFTEDKTIRITGDDGKDVFPLIQKDDIMGMFDFVASVIPSIAGKNDIDKKQGMDLFQLLAEMPFVDQQKLTGKVLKSWNWTLDSIIKKEEEGAGQNGEQVPGMPVDPSQMQGGAMPGVPMPGMGAPAGGANIAPNIGAGAIPQSVIAQIGKSAPAAGMSANNFAEASLPINLLNSGAVPPTVSDSTKNMAGFNRGGAVNTNISMKAPNGPEAAALTAASNLQS